MKFGKKSCRNRWLFFFLCIAILGCGKTRVKKPLIFCAASVAPVLESSLETWNIVAATQSGGSGVLLAQIKTGAEPNLLLLADERLVNELEASRILRQSIFASNQIVLVKARNNERVSGSALLSNQEFRLALAEPHGAPLGHYSQQALSGLDVRARVVILKDAGSVVSAVLSGHCELGLVYLSDAERLEQLEIAHRFPEDSHDPILYRILLLEPEIEEARQIYDRLTSSEGREVLQRAHFLPAP